MVKSLDIDALALELSQDYDEDIRAVQVGIACGRGIFGSTDNYIDARVTRCDGSQEVVRCGQLVYPPGGMPLSSIAPRILVVVAEGLLAAISRGPEELPMPPPLSSPFLARWDWWLQHGDCGRSSMTISHALHGVPTVPSKVLPGPAVPYDADDLRRCVQLLDLLPEWRDRILEVGDRVPAWRPMVARWAELEQVYRMERTDGGGYQDTDRLLKELRGEA